MKNMLTLIVLLSSWLTVYSQESYTEAELKQKCDSIVEEANTLYRYETAAWNFTDMIFAKPGLIETIQNILTYHQGDSIKCVAIDKQSYCIYEATFLNESAPCSEVTTRMMKPDSVCSFPRTCPRTAFKNQIYLAGSRNLSHFCTHGSQQKGRIRSRKQRRKVQNF